MRYGSLFIFWICTQGSPSESQVHHASRQFKRTERQRKENQERTERLIIAASGLHLPANHVRNTSIAPTRGLEPASGFALFEALPPFPPPEPPFPPPSDLGWCLPLWLEVPRMLTAPGSDIVASVGLLGREFLEVGSDGVWVGWIRNDGWLGWRHGCKGGEAGNQEGRSRR